MDMPILTCIFFTFNWLTLTSELHFVKFHPVVASCLLYTGKIKYAPLGMRLVWKFIRNYFLVYHLISPFLLYLQKHIEFEAETLDLQPLLFLAVLENQEWLPHWVDHNFSFDEEEWVSCKISLLLMWCITFYYAGFILLKYQWVIWVQNT